MLNSALTRSGEKPSETSAEFLTGATYDIDGGQQLVSNHWTTNRSKQSATRH